MIHGYAELTREAIEQSPLDPGQQPAGLFLISPDGRVIGKNIRGFKPRSVVAAALANEELFQSTATGQRPSRFPETRFELDPAAKVAELPSEAEQID